MNPGEGAAYTQTTFKPQQSLWAEAAQFRGEQRRADNRGTEASTESIALRSKGSYNSQRDITSGCSRKHRGVQMTCPQAPLRALAFPASVFLAALNNSQNVRNHYCLGNPLGWRSTQPEAIMNTLPCFVYRCHFSGLGILPRLLKFHSAFKVQQNPPLRVLPWMPWSLILHLK